MKAPDGGSTISRVKAKISLQVEICTMAKAVSMSSFPSFDLLLFDSLLSAGVALQGSIIVDESHGRYLNWGT